MNTATRHISFDTPWLEGVQPNPKAGFRLFCFPFAGGGAQAFRFWGRELPDFLEICPIQPPGRGRRFGEPPISRLDFLIQQLTPALLPYLEKPFGFYGHSLGSLVAFELSRNLRRHGLPQPKILFVASCSAPQVPFHDRGLLHQLPDPLLLEEIRRMGGTPSAVLADKEWRELLLPVLRADLAVLETYRYYREPPLENPIHACGGWEDPDVSQKSLEPWREQTCKEFSLRMLPGDHFFQIPYRKPLLEWMSEKIRGVAG